MGIKKFTAIALGKAIFKLTQALNIGGGSAAPGYYALKIYPNLVKDLASGIPQTIVITGTNGKTTTARMFAQIAQASGLKVLRNSTGSNLERGIASTLISNSYLLGKQKPVDLAIWELDEAAFNTVIPKINPDVIVILNVFRDQLDRYGEVDSVIQKWCKTLGKIGKDTSLLINGDDQNLLELKKFFKGKITTFGVENYKIRGENSFKKIGKEKLDLEAKNVNLLGLSGTMFELDEKDGTWHFSLPLPGIYHIYNFLAAYITASYLGINKQTIVSALQNFSPAFGRVEKFSLTPERWEAKQNGYIFLIKNPTGATQVLETLKGELKAGDRLLLALNDNLADGTDVSWIWDANFELIQNSSLREPEGSSEPRTARATSRDFNIFCSGTRAEDIALRLKYAGFDPESITIESNLEKAFEGAREGLEGRLFILPTYTALLSLQKILAKSGIKKHYWEEMKNEK